MTVIDRLARKQYEVEPREFEGRLLHQLPPSRSTFGEAYAELYLTTPDEDCRVALTKSGTRVIADLAVLPGLEHVPWTSRYLQGLIDVASLNLTPGTRSGIVHDEHYSAFVDSLGDLEAHLNSVIEEQRRAEEEQANTESLRAIQRSFREAMLVLPRRNTIGSRSALLRLQDLVTSSRHQRKRKASAKARSRPLVYLSRSERRRSANFSNIPVHYTASRSRQLLLLWL